MENLIPLVVGLARPNIPATDASLAQLAHAARVNCDGSSIAGESVCSISEIRTQMSEAFWRYGRPDDALNVLQGFETDPRKTYPGEEITQPNFFSSGACLHWGFGAALLTSVALPAVGGPVRRGQFHNGGELCGWPARPGTEFPGTHAAHTPSAAN